jgi:hypothetical protein
VGIPLAGGVLCGGANGRALGRMVRNLGAGVAPSLCRTGWSALWSEWSAIAQGHLSPRWNLDLTPSKRDLRVLRVDRSPGASPNDVVV